MCLRCVVIGRQSDICVTLIRFTGGATIVSFGHCMFTSLDYIGSAVGKRPIEHVIATGEWPNEYFNEHRHAIRP